MNFRLGWLPSVLRQAGLTVIEESGWETRGHGDMGDVRGVLLHHTAGPLKGDSPSLGVVIKGRPDLAGPLAQLFLARSGAWHVVAAGKAWHAGAGNLHGLTDGNGHLVGVEAENTGLPNDPWPAGQIDSYARGVAAILAHCHAQAEWCAGHKEYATPKGRKTDPSFDMDDFRDKVRGHLLNALTS
jgi:hypothetical protein